MPGSCKSNHGASPGGHPVIPNHAARLGPDAAAPYAGNFEVCQYCYLIHKDSHAQGLYPLSKEQMGPTGSAMVNTEPQAVPAGKENC